MELYHRTMFSVEVGSFCWACCSSARSIESSYHFARSTPAMRRWNFRRSDIRHACYKYSCFSPTLSGIQLTYWIIMSYFFFQFLSYVQQEDLLALGKLILALACNSMLALQRDNVPTSMDIINKNYSADLRNLIVSVYHPSTL